jgi:hypothetical protein
LAGAIPFGSDAGFPRPKSNLGRLHHPATAARTIAATIKRTVNVWGNAVHRVVTDGISPEQAVDEAIAWIKRILAE